MNFDLNIENYKRDELIQMFELPIHFNNEIVEEQNAKLRESIIKNSQMDENIKKKTLNFLIKAKNIILNENNTTPNTLDENIQYDPRYKRYYDLTKTELDDGLDSYPLQTRYEKPFVNSFPSEYYPGVINPLKKRIVKKNLVIDTKFRENYYNSSSTNFSFALPTNFNDVIELNLSSIRIPFSYYAVSKQYGNNFFSISVTPTGGSPSSSVITIPSGNYDQFSIITAINTELANAGTPFDLIAFNVGLNVGSVSGSLIGSGKTLVGPINSDDVSSYELNFQADIFGNPDNNTQLPLKFGWMLGFRNGIYENNLNYVSEGIIDVSGPKYIFLILDDYNNNVVKNFYSALNSSVLNNNILAQFPVVNASPFKLYIENSFASTTSPPRSYFGPVNIQNVTIQLMDEYGRIIDLNNMDYSLCITLTSIYDL